MPDLIPQTMFPALDGSDPGSAERVQNVTDAVLPDLNQRPESGLSMVPPGAEAPAAPVAEGAEAPAAEPAGKRRTLQERIDQLTRKRREAEEENSVLLQKINDLTNLISNQNITRNQPARPARADDSGLGDFGAVAGTDAGKDAVSTPGIPDVQGIVQQTIESYDRRRRQEEAAVGALQHAQSAAMQAVVEEWPEFADGRTNASKLFIKLYESSPMRGHPQAPYHIALQVRGLLADEAARTKPTEERKRLASVIVPTPAASDTGRIPTESLRKEFSRLQNLMQQGDTSFETYRRLRHVRSALQQKQ
jgi:hypothetical protein